MELNGTTNQIYKKPPGGLLRSNKSRFKNLYKSRWLYFLLAPGLLYFIIFKYLPMFGLVIVFKDYYPALGILGSKWVGFKHFIRFFSEPDFLLLFKNTLLISFYLKLFYFPLPIILALLLNEVRRDSYKRIIQSVTYLPHFLSWVVIGSLTYMFLTVDEGLVNKFLIAAGQEKVNFLMDPKYFRPILILQSIWKDLGWGTIIYLSAIASIEVDMYEAARIDGANRFQQMWYITLPSIISTIIVLFILRLGQMLNTGFEQIFLMLSATTRSVGEVFDTFVYRVGIEGGQFSYSTAIGMFKSVISLILVFAADRISKAFNQEGIF